MLNLNKKTTGFLCSLFAGMAFGAQFPVAEHILQRVNPFYFVTIRYVLAAMVFAPLLLIKEGVKAFRPEGKALLVWLFGTLAFTGYNGLVFLGQRIAGPAGPILSSVMMGVMPLITALILLVWKGVRMTRITAICIGVGLLGIICVATKGRFGALIAGGSTFTALLLMLAAVLCWSMYTVGASLFPSWSPLRYTGLTAIGGSLTNLLVISIGTKTGWLTVPAWHSLTSNTWPFLYMAVVAGVCAVLAWNTACKLIPPVDAMLVTNNVVPVMSAVITVLAGYRVGIPEVFGIALALLALITNNLAGRRKSGRRLQVQPQVPKCTMERPAGKALE